jgi:hypothetical protein
MERIIQVSVVDHALSHERVFYAFPTWELREAAERIIKRAGGSIVDYYNGAFFYESIEDFLHHNKEFREPDLRTQALAKLTEEEKRALGLI